MPSVLRIGNANQVLKEWDKTGDSYWRNIDRMKGRESASQAIPVAKIQEHNQFIPIQKLVLLMAFDAWISS